MRRSWRLVAAGALLLGAGALGVMALSSIAPELCAGALGQLLGRRVEIAAVDLRLGRTLEVELDNLEIFQVGASEPEFRTRRLSGSLRWPDALTGHLLPARWMLEEPSWVIEAGGGGPTLALPELPPLELEIRDGSAEYRPATGEGFRLVNLHVSGKRAPLRGVAGSAMGALQRGEQSVARFAVEFEGWLDDARLQGSFEEIDLSGRPFGAHTQGHARGTATAEYRGDELEAEIDLVAEGFHLSHESLDHPVAPADLRLQAQVSFEPGKLVVRPQPLVLDDLVIRGEVAVSTGPAGRLRAELSVGDFEVGTRPGRLQLLRLLGLRFKTFADIDQRSKAGALEAMRVTADLPLAGLADSLGFRRKLAPEEFHFVARARDGLYQDKPESTPLEGISGEVEISGNQLALRGVRMSQAGHPLPQLDIVVDGMHRLTHLPDAERKVPRGPGAPLAGLGPALRALIGAGDPARPDLVLRVERASLGYPAFLLPLRDASATLRFPGGNLLVEELRGVFGGAPAQIRALWDRTAERLILGIHYEDGEAPPASAPADVPAAEHAWLDGDFAAETLYLGKWRLDAVRGRFHGDGPSLELHEVSGKLAGGDVKARGYVSLGEPAAAPLAFVVDVSGAESSGVGPFLGFEPDDVTGPLEADGIIAGRLDPERKFLADADMRLDVRIRNGTLGNTPRTMLIARLASPLGWTGLFGRPLPCDEIALDLDIRQGKLRTEEFSLVGPELRMLAAGEIDLESEKLDTDLLVALLFLRTVDRVIGVVPGVGQWVLGPDRSLVALYFQLQGPWDDPTGLPLPPTALTTAAGWAGRLLGGGVQRILDVLGAKPPRSGNGAGDASENASGAGEAR
jgi:hypothetical protein